MGVDLMIKLGSSGANLPEVDDILCFTETVLTV